MPKNQVIIKQLNSWIGRVVRFQDAIYEIIEVLEDGPALVLQDAQQHTTIQPDQHGEAHRRVPHTCTVHIPIINEHIDLTEAGIELLPVEHLT